MANIFRPGGPERYAHQKEGLRRLIQQRGLGALVYDPGTGKTATTIDYLSVLTLKKKEEETRVLVIAPLVAVDTWVLQMEEWASPDVNFWAEALGGTLLQRAEALASRGGQPYTRPLSPKNPLKPAKGQTHRAWHVQRSLAVATRPALSEEALKGGPDVIPGRKIVLASVNIDTFSQRAQVGSRNMADVMMESVKRFRPDVIVIDESHKIKGASSNVSRLMARVSKLAPRRIILTGTVMPHSPLDIFGQWRFLDPYAFGQKNADGTVRQATFGNFRNTYCQFGGWLGKEVVGFKNLDHMQDVMAQLAHVVKKEDALDLPKTTDATLRVDLSPKEKKAYAELKKSLATDLAQGVTVTTTSMLTQALRLRQLTSGYLPDDTGKTHVIGRSKVNAIKSLVHDTLAGENRIVIFALFTKEIELLTEALQAKGTEVLTVTGGTPVETRIAYRKRFGSSDPARLILVAQIQTMSMSVNELVTASHAIFASMTQQRDEYIQARDRLNRIGQTRPVTFWHAVAPGTVDEIILQAHRDRTNLETKMLHHIRDQS